MTSASMSMGSLKNIAALGLLLVMSAPAAHAGPVDKAFERYRRACWTLLDPVLAYVPLEKMSLGFMRQILEITSADRNLRVEMRVRYSRHPFYPDQTYLDFLKTVQKFPHHGFNMMNPRVEIEAKPGWIVSTLVNADRLPLLFRLLAKSYVQGISLGDRAMPDAPREFTPADAPAMPQLQARESNLIWVRRAAVLSTVAEKVSPAMWAELLRLKYVSNADLLLKVRLKSHISADKLRRYVTSESVLSFNEKTREAFVLTDLRGAYRLLTLWFVEKADLDSQAPAP